VLFAKTTVEGPGWMAAWLREVRVCIASPGGLEAERRCFYRTIAELDAYTRGRGVALSAVGWEAMPAGLGGQERINAEIRECDYAVVLLHDRWGAPPTGDSSYTSRTEEEYHLARQCVADRSLPMRDIAFYFKDLEGPDPGDGGNADRVRDFRRALEAEGALLFATFDSLRTFNTRLITLLLGWAREHEWNRRGASGLPPEVELEQGASRDSGERRHR